MRRLGLRSRGSDQGAIAVIVGVLLGFGLILGLAALTVDVGSINAERRILQNGADAAAMSVARTCVDTGTCPTADNTALVNLVNLNDVKDHHTKIARVDGQAAVCGKITTDTSLPACPPLQPGLYDCPSPQKLPAQYIRVYTQTQNSAKSTDTILPPFFGQAVVGGYKGVTQQTCASVGIGSLGSSPNALPVVVAQCAYDAMMAKNDPDFPPMPPPVGASQTTPVALPTGYAKYVTSVVTHTVAGKGVPPKCDYDSRSGLYVAGGFGWTETVGNTCSANFTYDSGTWTMPIGNGASTPTGCRNTGTSPLSFVGTITHIPIMTGISADGKYIIDGLAGFYVAGYNAPAANPKFWDGYNGAGALALRGNDDGFWGWFTKDFVPVGDFGTTPDPRGPTVLGNIG